MKVVVLAAGMSTRLQSIAKGIPKPMIEISGKPMIMRVIEYLITKGFDDIIVTLHYNAKMIQNYLVDEVGHNAKIEYAYENKLLGTAGSLKKNMDKLEEPFLVCSGSFLLPDLDIESIKKIHLKKDYVGTVVLNSKIPYEELANFGQAILSPMGEIIRFEEKPKEQFSNLVHSTYQFYNPSVFSYIQENEYVSLPDDVIPSLVREHKVQGIIYEGDLLNISTIEAYNRTLNYFEKEKKV